MAKILVLGAQGQLGQCLAKVAEKQQIQGMIFPPKDEANILDMDGLQRLFEQHQPDFAINCAAYTAVDKAEDEMAAARKVNCDGAANIARLCKAHNATLIHISTDFVFEGNTPYPLVEADATNPISVYGLTKLEGEKAIAELTDAYFTLRTSWLYSEYGNNFVKTMLRLAEGRDELKIIADQVGTPTYAIDLARTIFAIIESGSQAYGIYHYSNEGVTSWYDFAKGVFDVAGVKIKVLPIRTHEYPTKAVRPPFSVMDKTKIKQAFGISISYWRDSLVECMGKL
ncbi:dTDP-4-dehydrorhamnose reductase [Mucilaginibacter koreensis]